VSEAPSQSPWGTPVPAWPTGERTQFEVVGGYPFAYVEAGARLPALVLVHGSMSDLRAFQFQVPALARSSRTISMSLRHFYPERWSGSGDDFSVERHAEDVAAFIEARGLGPVHLLGHSRGGAVALQVALCHPRIVRTLILADPGGLESLLPPSAEGEAMARQSVEMFARLRDNLARGDVESALRRFVEDLNGPGAWEKRTPEQRQVMRDNVTTGPACAQRPAFTPGDVASLAMPILAMTGSASPARYRLMLEAMRARNPNVREIVTLEGAAHGMQRDRPEAFNAAVRAFVEAH
jgi:pimeloyl-ACP methyl ester carboxylesterase